MFESISLSILHAAVGLVFGKLGLWGPDQPFDPNNPINPWASVFTTGFSGVLFGALTLSQFGKGELVLSTVGAAVGSNLAMQVVRSLNVFGKSK